MAMLNNQMVNARYWTLTDAQMMMYDDMALCQHGLYVEYPANYCSIQKKWTNHEGSGLAIFRHSQIFDFYSTSNRMYVGPQQCTDQSADGDKLRLSYPFCPWDQLQDPVCPSNWLNIVVLRVVLRNLVKSTINPQLGMVSTIHFWLTMQWFCVYIYIWFYTYIICSIGFTTWILLMFHRSPRHPNDAWLRENTTDKADPNDLAIMKAADLIASASPSTIIAIPSTDTDFLEAWRIYCKHLNTDLTLIYLDLELQTVEAKLKCIFLEVLGPRFFRRVQLQQAVLPSTLTEEYHLQLKRRGMSSLALVPYASDEKRCQQADVPVPRWSSVRARFPKSCPMHLGAGTCRLMLNRQTVMARRLDHARSASCSGDPFPDTWNRSRFRRSIWRLLRTSIW